MFDFLKTVKKTYAYFLIFCFIAIWISFSIMDRGNIDKAINELSALNSSDLTLNNKKIIDTLNTVYEKTVRTKISSLSEKLDRIRKKYDKYNYGISLNLYEIYTSPKYSINKDYKSKTLRELSNTLIKLNDEKIWFFFPEINDFDNILNVFFSSLEDDNNKYISFNQLTYNSNKRIYNFYLSIYHNYDWEKDLKTDEEKRILHIIADSIQCEHSWLNLLFEINQISEFVEKDDSHEFTVFPSLRSFWQNVQYATPSNALSGLKEDRLNTPVQQTITLFGIKIDLSPMKFLGQIILVLLFLYFYLHLSHFELRNPDKKTIDYFPWVAIYNGSIPNIITFFTIFILPSFSIVIIAIGFWTDDVFYNCISMIFSFVAIAIALYLGKLINNTLIRLRK